MKKEHLGVRFYFRPARPWYTKTEGKRVINEFGLADVNKLITAFESAFASIGATDLLFKKEPKVKACLNFPQCGKWFVAKRSTARFCPDCREDVYALRMRNPKYSKLNQERARKGMKKLRDRRVRELVEKIAKLKRSGQ